MHHVYAHRGSSAAYAENTRAAYLQALADGADGIECDVHLTRDGRIVCHHDQTVDRTSNASGRISSFTLQELRELDFASWKGREIPADYGTLQEQLLTLGELVELAASAGRPIGLAVEIKHPSEFGRRLEDAVLAELTRLGWEAATSKIGDVTLSFMCFDPGSVRHLSSRVAPDFLCQLVTGANPRKVAALEERGDHLGAQVASVVYGAEQEGVPAIEAGTAGVAGPGVAWVRRHEDTVRAWLHHGTRLRVWTVDREEDIEFLAGVGVQEMTSNDPKHTRDVLNSLARA
ncbi:glycerophosphodiester phosphodiesterase [Arthrobacter rhombi]|uniref:glycerophosphodiester phosphodiesterase n=1 Tax=Arthrobacter rhombi TaxID=71253 RepID=UPI003FD467F4